VKGRFVTLAGLLVAALVGGAVVEAAASGSVGSSQGGGASASYRRNAAGHTYGSLLKATSPDTEPDLIQAVAADGTVGYVYAKDLRTPDPASPAEAAARPLAVSRSVLLYASDGKTVVGVFRLGTSSAAPPSK